MLLLQEPDLLYKTREEQGQLLQQVLAASDIDADEERIPGEGPRVGPTVSGLRSLHTFVLLYFHGLLEAHLNPW
jgi:hypothetical protein